MGEDATSPSNGPVARGIWSGCRLREQRVRQGWRTWRFSEYSSGMDTKGAFRMSSAGPESAHLQDRGHRNRGRGKPVPEVRLFGKVGAEHPIQVEADDIRLLTGTK